jgi:nucleoside-diphosphate-sugar epimerase
MRLLVTGNGGYIGTVMVPLLQAEGFSVTGLDSGLFEDCVFGDPSVTGGISDVSQLRKDIRDVKIEDLKGIDAIVHLCALSNDPLGNLNPKVTYEINHVGSVRLAELAKKAGVKRFVFSSSCSVYGASTAHLVNEKSRVKPVTPYAVSKVLAERDISKLASAEFTPIFLRSATAYGLSPMLRFDLVVNNFVAWAFTKGIVLLKSDGSAWRPFVHIQDISHAFIAALNAPKDAVHNQILNVGKNEENFRIREVSEIVRKTIPNSRIEFVEGAEADKRSYKVEFEKIAEVLPEFKIKWSVPDGAKQLYEAYKKVGLLVEEFEGPRFRRITHLENSLQSGRVDNTLRRVDLTKQERKP